MKFNDTTRAGYSKLWGEMIINENHKNAAIAVAQTVVSHCKAYRAVQNKIGVPWWWIGITHQLEAGGNFRAHLHNGDSLSHRTVHVPAGRPASGSPPFTWEESAIDALQLKRLHNETDWSVPKALYEFERYNGFGYVAHRINSPYLWSFSNHYKCGKYVADGVWDAGAVSKQCGAAVVLKTLINQGVLKMSSDLSKILDAAEEIVPTVATLAGQPVIGALAKAGIDAVQALTEDAETPVPAKKEPAPQVLTPNANGVLVDAWAALVKTILTAMFVFLGTKLFRDATLATTIADQAANVVIGLGSLACSYLSGMLLHRSIKNANENTVQALTGKK